jgi:serine O-acetyltransferase
MNKLIQADLYRYNGFSGIRGFFKGLQYPGFRYTWFLRKTASTSKYSPFGIFYRIMLSHYKYKYGFQIPATTIIGKGFFIGHFGTIVINSKAIIGDNCNFSHGVTIGKANRGKAKGVPVLGDRVWVGTGAVIVGNVKIGSDVLIAPNAYVNFDVPSHSIVLGNPGKIIERQNPTEGYINFQSM